MAIDTTAFHAKGRNVTPLSSTLKFQTLPADCSGSDWPAAPVDGEWLHFAGYGEAATHANADLTISASDFGLGAMSCMVWSHRDRSDRSALGQTRVPVIFKESFHCELGLYNYDSAALPEAGWLIKLEEAADEVLGGSATNKRLVAEPFNALAALGEEWIVGHVVGGAGTSTAGEPLEVVLYDMPRMITMSSTTP